MVSCALLWRARLIWTTLTFKSGLRGLYGCIREYCSSKGNNQDAIRFFEMHFVLSVYFLREIYIKNVTDLKHRLCFIKYNVARREFVSSFLSNVRYWICLIQRRVVLTVIFPIATTDNLQALQIDQTLQQLNTAITDHHNISLEKIDLSYNYIFMYIYTYIKTETEFYEKYLIDFICFR